MKHIKKYSPLVPHLLQAQQALSLLYAKVAGRPSTGSYPALSHPGNCQVQHNDVIFFFFLAHLHVASFVNFVFDIF